MGSSITKLVRGGLAAMTFGTSELLGIGKAIDPKLKKSGRKALWIWPPTRRKTRKNAGHCTQPAAVFWGRKSARSAMKNVEAYSGIKKWED